MKLYSELFSDPVGSGCDGYSFDKCSNHKRYYNNNISPRMYMIGSELENYVRDISGESNVIIELLQNVKDEELASTIEDSYKYYNNPLML